MRNIGLVQNNLQINPAMYYFAKGLIIVSRLAILIIITQWMLASNLLWFQVGVVSLALTFIPLGMVQDRALYTATRVCISLLFCAHIILGMQLGLYENSIIYDKLVHVLGTSAITALVLMATIQYSHRLQLNLPQTFVFVWVLSMAISAGTLWELFEFVMDRTGLIYAQRGMHDTMLDLVSDTVGAITTLALYAGIRRISGFALKS